MKFEEGNFVCIEYEVGKYWSRKTLHLHSDHLVIPSELSWHRFTVKWLARVRKTQMKVAMDLADYNIYKLTKKSIGDYQNTAEHLKGWMSSRDWQQCSPQKIVSLGHGGRDIWLTWAMVEATVAASLHNETQFHILTSVWSDKDRLKSENWTAAMKAYINTCKVSNVDLETMSWEDPMEECVRKMKNAFKSASVILQCEQGLDYFVLPDRHGRHPILDCFLQDNFEDWMSFPG